MAARQTRDYYFGFSSEDLKVREARTSAEPPGPNRRRSSELDVKK